MLESFVRGFKLGSVVQAEVLKNNLIYGYDSEIARGSHEKVEATFEDSFRNVKTSNKLIFLAGFGLGEGVALPVNLPLYFSYCLKGVFS